MTQQDQSDINAKNLAQAFKDWDFTPRLGTHPFSQLNVVKTYRAAAGYADTDAGRGRALRELLASVIVTLAADEGEPDFHAKRWRSHLILRERYIQGLGQDYIAAQLGIARSTYNHEQKRALGEAADILLTWEDLGLPPDVVPEGIEAPTLLAPPFTAPPRPPQGLVGREDLMAQAQERLSPGNWLSLYGLPGVGKTSLAIELAHDQELRALFPDGVLWAGLGADLDFSHWLTIWGSELGLRSETLTGLVEVRQKAQAVHAAIGELQILLVVDDVWRAEDGLMFRLGGPNTGILFTTRFPAVANELAPAGTIQVRELNDEQGIQLLGRYVPSLAQRRESTAQDLVDLAGGLPMALVLIGGYLRREAYSGQSRRLAEAIEQLMSLEQVLDVPGIQRPLEGRADLDPSEELTLRKVIELSEAALSPEGAASLRWMALHPPKPASFPESVAIAIIEHGAAPLDELVDMGLLEVVGEARYSMHSAINAYGRLVGGTNDRERFIKVWMSFLAERENRASQIFPEMANILRALDLALECEDWTSFVPAINRFYPYLERAGRVEAGLTYLERAKPHLNDVGEAMEGLRTLVHLGRAQQRLGEYVKAREYYQMALGQPSMADAHDLRCACLQGLGVVSFSQGDFRDAEDYYSQGLAQARQHDLVQRRAALLSNQGTLFISKANPESAMDCFLESLRLARALGDRSLEGVLLSNLGALAAQGNDFEAANGYFEESLELARAGGERFSMAILLNNLGTLANDRGDPKRAQDHFEQALGEALQMGDRAQASRILANLGALHTARGDFDQAETLLKEGLTQAEAIQHVENRILITINLAELARFRENSGDAKEYLDQAEVLAVKARHQRYQNVIAEMKVELGDK